MLSKMNKESLELLSYTKIAEMYLRENKKTMNTADLFREVCSLLELSENEYQERIADFFESLTTSKVFILLNDGNWDLKENHSVKIDMDDIYDDSDDVDVSGEDDIRVNDLEEDNYEEDICNPVKFPFLCRGCSRIISIIEEIWKDTLPALMCLFQVYRGEHHLQDQARRY